MSASPASEAIAAEEAGVTSEQFVRTELAATISNVLRDAIHHSSEGSHSYAGRAIANASDLVDILIRIPAR